MINLSRGTFVVRNVSPNRSAHIVRGGGPCRVVQIIPLWDIHEFSRTVWASSQVHTAGMTRNIVNAGTDLVQWTPLPVGLIMRLHLDRDPLYRKPMRYAARNVAGLCCLRI